MNEAPPSKIRALLESYQQDITLSRRNGLERDDYELPLFKRVCSVHGHCLDEVEESEEGELHCPAGEWVLEWGVERVSE